MAKYSYEFKQKIVQAYLNGEGGYGYLAKSITYLQKETLKHGCMHTKSLENKDYGYRRVYRELRNRKIFVNKKKVQRIIQKLGFQVTSLIVVLIHLYHIKR